MSARWIAAAISCSMSAMTVSRVSGIVVPLVADAPEVEVERITIASRPAGGKWLVH